MWNSNSGECLRTLLGHEYPISCVESWCLKTKRCIQTLEGHSDYVTCVQTITNEKLASSSIDKIIKIRNLVSGKCIKTILNNEAIFRFYLL